MAGTVEGGKKAAATNMARDPGFYAKIGAKGGKNGHTGGFAANPELARTAGKLGGKISRYGGNAKPLTPRQLKEIEQMREELGY